LRLNFVVLVAVALVIACPAFADITVSFNSPVTFVGFYSSEPFNLTWSDGVGSGTANSGYTLGAFTNVNDSGVTSVDFSGTPNFYVLDDFKYTTVNGETFTLPFDETILQNCGCSIGGFYAGLPGGPVFSKNADVLTYPNYNYSGYPYESFPDVIYEGSTLHSPTPEPGTLLMVGSGVLGLAGVIRKKLSL